MSDSTIQLYDVKVVVRSDVKLISEVKEFLSSKPNRLNLFKRTVFGPWLDLAFHDNDNHLMHYVLQHQLKVNEKHLFSPILFRIGDHTLEFGRKEFSLLTGFRLGVVSFDCEKLESCFITRLFSGIVLEKNIIKVKLAELLNLARDEKRWATLQDIDAVRVCLIIIADLVFMGKEDRNCITRHFLTLVEDLDKWNDYPWGEYMWQIFYERTVNVVHDHRQYHLEEKSKNPNYNAQYNLYGFPWAFKIWILESFPKSIKWWSKNQKVVPRCLAWTNVTRFRKSHYSVLFGHDCIPILKLEATSVEKAQAWYDASIPFFNGVVVNDGSKEANVGSNANGSVYVDDHVCNNALTNGEKVVSGGLGNVSTNDENVCNDVSVSLTTNEKGCKNALSNDENVCNGGSGRPATAERTCNDGSGVLFKDDILRNADSQSHSDDVSAGLFNESTHHSYDEVEGLGTELSHLRKEEEYLRNCVSNLTKEVGDLRKEVTNPNNEVGDLRNEVTNLTNEVGDLKKEVANLNNEVGDLRKEVTNLTNEVGDLRKEVAVIKDHEDRIKKLEALLTENLKNGKSSDISPRSCLADDIGRSVNDPTPNCACPDDEITNLYCGGMAVDKHEGNFDGSQIVHESVDVLLKACGYVSQHPEMDLLKVQVNEDSFYPTINKPPVAEPVNGDAFCHDYTNLLNEEELIPSSSLDDMKFQRVQENLPTTDNSVQLEPISEDVGDVTPEQSLKYVNVVNADYKFPLDRVVPANIKIKSKKCSLKRKYTLRSLQERNKKVAIALDSPFEQLQTTTPPPPKPTSLNHVEDSIIPPNFEDISGQPKIRSVAELMTVEVFVENLSRPDDCKKSRVNVPDDLCDYLQLKDPPEYRFPWGKGDLSVDRTFWLQLGCLDIAKKGWLNSDHIDLWVDVMWSFREPNANWAIAGAFFVTYLLGGNMPACFCDGKRYPVAWRNVEKVYFPVNEPDKHWCLAELQIGTGVVTFYDTLGWAKGNRRPFWKNMKRDLPRQLSSYLDKHGVLKSKGIAVEQYVIKYAFPNIVRQIDDSGDCGVWVCILLYRLCCKKTLAFKDPAQTCFAYRENMIQYFWKHKFPSPKKLYSNEGTILFW